MPVLFGQSGLVDREVKGPPPAEQLRTYEIRVEDANILFHTRVDFIGRLRIGNLPVALRRLARRCISTKWRRVSG